MRLPLPELIHRREDGADRPLLVWRFEAPVRAVSSAPLGGGLGDREWVINATVAGGYQRMDPDVHLVELADGLGLRGAGVGLLTAVDVEAAVTAEDGGVVATATVGLSYPTWAAAPDGDLRVERPGTINVLAWLPVALSDAALVNAVATATEAKVQALLAAGVAATGTATDAICLVCPRVGSPDGSMEAYGGPRSIWGARLARAVHEAVARGAEGWRRPESKLLA